MRDLPCSQSDRRSKARHLAAIDGIGGLSDLTFSKTLDKLDSTRQTDGSGARHNLDETSLTVQTRSPNGRTVGQTLLQRASLFRACLPRNANAACNARD